jgi:hypothetical protein
MYHVIVNMICHVIFHWEEPESKGTATAAVTAFTVGGMASSSSHHAKPGG